MINRLNETFVVLISVLIFSLKFPFELKEIKQNVVFSKEKKIDELKTSLLVFTLVNVYVDLVVFTRIAGTS